MAYTFRRLGRAYQAAALARRAGEALNRLKSWLTIGGDDQVMRLLRRLLSAAREMVRDRAKVMADLDKTERRPGQEPSPIVEIEGLKARSWLTFSREAIRRPDQRIDAVDQGGALHRRLLVGMLQPDRLVEQHVASRGHTDTDRLPLVEERRVGSILQRQEMGDEAERYSVSMPEAPRPVIPPQAA